MPDTTDTSTVVDLDARRRVAEAQTAAETAAALEQLVFRLEESLRELYRGSTALPGLADKIEDLFRDDDDQFVEVDGEFLRGALAKSTHRIADFDLHLSELQDVINRATQEWFAIVKVIPGLMDEITPLSHGDRWDSLPEFA